MQEHHRPLCEQALRHRAGRWRRAGGYHRPDRDPLIATMSAACSRSCPSAPLRTIPEMVQEGCLAPLTTSRRGPAREVYRELT